MQAGSCRALKQTHLVYRPILQTFKRFFAAESNPANTEDSQPRYFQGKRIIEEVENEFEYEHVLLNITGYDAAVLDSFVNVVQVAAKMAEVNLTKSFNLPAVFEHLNVRKSDSQLRKEQMQYKLKRHQRILQIVDVTEDKVDVFVESVQEKLPCGVEMKFELKRWEELVAPNHPSLQKADKSVSRYQKT